MNCYEANHHQQAQADDTIQKSRITCDCNNCKDYPLFTTLNHFIEFPLTFQFFCALWHFAVLPLV